MSSHSRASSSAPAPDSLQPPADSACARSGQGLEAYRTGRLPPAERERLLSHVLSCPWCVAHHWTPFTAAAEQEAEAVLAEVLGEAYLEAHEPLQTFHGATLTEPGASRWTAPGRRRTETTSLEAPETVFYPRLVEGGGLRLHLVGTVLPKVPEPRVLKGYYWYLGAGLPHPKGSPQTPLRLEVSLSSSAPSSTEHVVQVSALEEGGILDGVPLEPKQTVRLTGTHFLQVGAWAALFEKTVPGLEGSTSGASSWPPVGLLRQTGQVWPLRPDVNKPVVYQIGRDGRRCQIPLRDDPERGNLLWDKAALARLPAEQRSPLEKLTLDSFGVSREHAELEVTPGGVRFRATGSNPVMCLQGSSLKRLRAGEAALELRPGALLQVGHQLFELRA